MRISSRNINRHLSKQIEDSFAQTISDFKNAQEISSFLKDFFTETEYEMFIKRLAVAYWLRKGRSYANIKENLKVSSATIASVQELLTRPGFQNAIKIMEADEWANKWSERIKGLVNTPKKAL